MRRLLALFVCIVMVLSMFTGCTEDSSGVSGTDSLGGSEAQPSGGQSGAEKTMRMATWNAPSGAFMPALMNNDYDSDVINLTNEPLLIVNPELQLEPCLAESYEFTEDGNGVVFHLKQGITWHDGEPFTAADVKFTYEFISRPDYVGYYTSYPKDLLGYEEFHSGNAESLKGVEIIDDYTIKMQATGPIGSSLENLGYWVRICPKHIWDGMTYDEALSKTDMLRNPVGTGPFMLDEFVPDQYTVLKKYTGYWGGEPKLDKVILQVTNQETVEAQALKGDIDFFESASLSADDMEMYESKGFKIEMTPLLYFQHLCINNSHPLLGIKEVKQALMHAIDRQGIVDSTIYGFGNVANNVYAPIFWGYPGEDKLNPYEYDPDKAIKILTEQVGWQYKDGRMYADGNPVKFTLYYPSGQKSRELAAPIIQENLKNIGIEIELNIMEFTTMSSKMQEGEDGYEMALMGYGYGTNGDIKMLFHTDSIDNSLNFTRFSNTELDKLMVEMNRLNSVEEKAPVAQEIGKITNEELPTLFLYNNFRMHVLSPKLSGIRPSAITTYYKANDWYFEE